jgi:acyl-CoA synthetase (AMP-forming)/AMP-acid ligase II
VERFAAFLEPCGFRSAMISPIYGLAENTLTVACSEHGVGPVVDRIDRRALEQEGRALPAAPEEPRPKQVVSVGRAVAGVRVKVVDDQGREQAERREGRILVSGDSLMKGYFQNPEATADALRDGWLWTGDLGYLADGQLFVTGRTKDLIVHQGSKVHPQDLEEAAGSVPGAREGCCAAFGVEDPDRGGTQIVVLVESAETVAERRRAIEAEVVAQVAAQVGCRPDRVVVLPPRSLPKTSSGKIRRAECRDLWESGRLAAF